MKTKVERINRSDRKVSTVERAQGGNINPVGGRGKHVESAAAARETTPRATIMALDVGFRNMGVVIFDPSSDQLIACRTIKTEPSNKRLQVRKADDNSRRAAEMARELSDMIDRYNVRGAVGELPSGGSKSHSAATQMAAATAVAAAVLELKSIPTEWSTPSEGKVALCGSKTASKEDMMAEARRLYGGVIELPKAKAEFEHIADAIAAYIAQKNSNIKRLLS